MGFDRTDEFPDFYFSNGLYYYYREKYPELRPFYKSFLWLFPSGNKEKGIEDLKMCTHEGIFSSEMAHLYLFHIYLRYENNGRYALSYAKNLYTQYPQNTRFKTIYAESLIAEQQYALAEPLAQELAQETRLFFSVPGFTFKGMIAEGRGDLEFAKMDYLKALELSHKMGKKFKHKTFCEKSGEQILAGAERQKY